MKVLIILLTLVSLYYSQYTVNNVLKFGAVGNGKTDDTAAIQKAFAACSSSGCQVVFPTGYNFLSFPFSFSTSNLQIYVEKGAQILANNDVKSWPSKDGNPVNFITNTGNLNNVTITGQGIINGQGAVWWEGYKNGTITNRPMLVFPSHITGLVISYITLLDAPMVNLSPQNSVNVEIFLINITAPESSPNTDGIDPASCTNVHVHNVYINNGDDCLALNGGCQNILVENSVFFNGHGASIGSYVTPFVKDVIFRNIEMTYVEWACRIKWRCSEENGEISNITYHNITVNSARQQSLFIDANYEDQTNCNTYSNPVILNGATFSDIIVDNVKSEAEGGAFFSCNSNAPCTNIVVSGVNLNPTGSNLWECQSVSGTATNNNPASCV